MNSCLYSGTVWHTRYTPVHHRFNYPMLMAGFDLSELQGLSAQCTGFSMNKRNVMALYEKDYLKDGDRGLSDAVTKWFVEPRPERVVLLTMPRVYGYVFNPISLFLGFGPNNRLAQVVVQVNNTFGDRHIYPLNELQESDGVYTASCPKAFHVSPFFDLEGEYRFVFKPSSEKMEIHCDYYEGDTCRLESGFSLRSEPLTKYAAVKHGLRFPFRVGMTMPRILFQAFKLHYVKKLKAYARPEPTSSDTVKSKGRST